MWLLNLQTLLLLKLNQEQNGLSIEVKDKRVEQEKYSESQEVNIKTLDNYFKDKNVQEIDLLKIDTQGYEDKVLIGCQETLKKNKIKAIIVEIMFDNVYEKYFLLAI